MGYTGCVPLVPLHSCVAQIVAAICHIKKLDFDLIAHPRGLPFSTYAHGCRGGEDRPEFDLDHC